MLIGLALSPIVAAALSQSTRQRATFSIFPRLILLGCPLYLGVDYLIYQGPMMGACAGTSFAFGVYILRGWWVPPRLFDSIHLRLRRHVAMAEKQSAFASLVSGARTMFLTGKQRAAFVARAALRSRALADIRGSISVTLLNSVQIQRRTPESHFTGRPSIDGDHQTKKHPDREQANAAYTSGISLFITQAQKAQLRQSGFADEQIRNMLPVEAHRILGLNSSSDASKVCRVGRPASAARSDN